MAIHSKEQEQLAMEHEPPSSPLRENPSTPNSSFRLQEIPNSSLDMSYNKTMDFDACIRSPPRQRREELETVLEENKNTISEEKNSSFSEKERTPPPLELEDNDSLGSISSSPKNSVKLLHESFLEENINIPQ